MIQRYTGKIANIVLSQSKPFTPEDISNQLREEMIDIDQGILEKSLMCLRDNWLIGKKGNKYYVCIGLLKATCRLI